MGDFGVEADLVHKADGSNNWLPAARDGRDGSLEFDFRIPDGIVPGLSEYVELQRQATHVFAHLRLGARRETLAMLETVTIRRAARALGGSGLPRAGRVEVRSSVPSRLGAGSVDVDVDIALSSGDAARALAAGRITGKYLPRRLYDRLRLASRGEPIGREDVEAAAPGRVVAPLVADRANPILTDHETDHVTGMTVVCAVEAVLAERLPGRPILALEARFAGFIERDRPATIVLDVDGTSARAAVLQDGARRALVAGTIGTRRAETP